MDDLDKKIEDRTRNYILIFLAGILLHMFFSGENYVFSYLSQVGISFSSIFSFDFLHSIYFTFAYAFAGILASIILIGPIVYFFHKKHKKKLFASVNYAIFVGLIFRILANLIELYGSYS